VKKLTPIITIYHTANFLEEANSTGNVIDYTRGRHFELVPVARLTKSMGELGAYVDTTDHYTRLLLSFSFDGGAPVTPMAKLPADLLFYLTAGNMEKVRASGLPFNNRLLFVKPLPAAAAANYVFQKKTVSCRPCGATALLAAADLVPHIAADVTLDGIRTLIQKPLGSADKTLDLKVTVAGNVFPLVKGDDLKDIHKALQAEQFRTIALSFHKQSDNSLLADFPKILVTDPQMPVSALGVVTIPLAEIKVTETDPAKYTEINNFVLHFPLCQLTLSLTVNTPAFDPGSKLLVDGVAVPGAAVVNHPQMPNYKMVTGTVNNYKVYLYKSKLVTIEQATRKTHTPIDPMNTYKATTNTSTITITK